MEDLTRNIILPDSYPFKLEIINSKMLVLVPKKLDVPLEQYVLSIMARDPLIADKNSKKLHPIALRFNKYYHSWLVNLPVHRLLQIENEILRNNLDISNPPTPEMLHYISKLSETHKATKLQENERNHALRFFERAI